MSGHSICPDSPVQAVLPCLIFPGCALLAVSFWQPNPSCPFLAVLSWLSFPGKLILAVLS